MIELCEITEEERNKLLAEEESHVFELKSVLTTPKKITVTISAFANADGGEIYIGIDQKNKKKKNIWKGFPNQETANAHIQEIAKLFPMEEQYRCTFLKCVNSHGLVLKVDVARTPDIIKSSDGSIFIRKGAQNLPVKLHDEIKRLEFNKGTSTLESETIDVDPNIVINSQILKDFLFQIIPVIDKKDWVRKNQLTRKGKPTVAAILLFAEEPQSIIPYCGIKIVRYKTQDREGNRDVMSDLIDIEGHIYKMIQDSATEVTKIIENIAKLSFLGPEPLRYPPEAIHEIITNAVLHRDYSIHSEIQIRIFDNRVEVESPGKLPGHITVSNILNERFSRNSAIVRWIHKFPNPPNKNIGEGLNTVFRAMRNRRLRPPIIDETENSVILTIKHESLESPDTTVVNYLESHYEITNSKARELTGITSENVMKQVFYRLQAKDLIERVPEKRGVKSSWRKKGAKPIQETFF